MGLLATSEKATRPLRVFVVYFEMVIDVSAVRGNLTTTHRKRFERWNILERPAHPIHCMHRLLHEPIAAQPDEIVPVTHLPFEVAHSRRARAGRGHRLDRAGVVRSVKHSDITDRSIVNLLE